jgi:hypothetical protein
MNLQTVYVEEQATNAGAIDLLEAETSSRIQLENEVNELRVINISAKKLYLIKFGYFIIIFTFYIFSHYITKL